MINIQFKNVKYKYMIAAFVFDYGSVVKMARKQNTSRFPSFNTIYTQCFIDSHTL